jgi:hypothetical protein
MQIPSNEHLDSPHLLEIQLYAMLSGLQRTFASILPSRGEQAANKPTIEIARKATFKFIFTGHWLMHFMQRS